VQATSDALPMDTPQAPLPAAAAPMDDDHHHHPRLHPHGAAPGQAQQPAGREVVEVLDSSPEDLTHIV